MKQAGKIVVVGAGGHAKVVISAVREMGLVPCAAYDDDQSKLGREILGVPIVGPIARLVEDDGTPTVLAIGCASIRQRIAEQFKSRRWATVLHSRAWIDPSVKIGPGTVVFAGAIIQPDVTIGKHAIINTAATVDHDCRLGDFVHIGPGSHLAASVSIGDGAFLGTGTSVIPGVCIGEGALIGAGAVVVRNIPPGVIAMGCPARPTSSDAASAANRDEKSVDWAKGVTSSTVGVFCMDRTDEITQAMTKQYSSDVRHVVESVVQGILGETGRGKPELSDANGLFTEIGLDSLDFARVVVELEQRLGIDPFRSGDRAVQTFGEFVALYRERLEESR